MNVIIEYKGDSASIQFKIDDKFVQWNKLTPIERMRVMDTLTGYSYFLKEHITDED